MVRQEFSCCLDPETGGKLILYLYKDVKNLDEIRQKVLSGELKCCIMKASLISDPFHVTVAANKALSSSKDNTMKTRTIYSEILFNLSLSKNITQSLTTFGIDDKETSLMVAFIQEGSEDIKLDVLKLIDGQQCCMDELKDLNNKTLIEKTYKIQPHEYKYGLTDLIVSKLAIKDFA